ncbi:MAG: hypothetical protein K9N46_10825 [Candidatus Marinimicrobia bacterium]|nr:hypothetical protein [Candidatus Neomarinimicrobiota bacterium]MCF7827726.1 hypothetical protein [Candidatus Neomarinimicrobiota bacterium]MCF7881219.1 hypothetical protein [Candidatus Neomarinimicrobiota bacterium]
MKVAIATCESEVQTNTDDALVLQSLRQNGVDAELVVWDNAVIKWDQFNVVILRSVWDYTRKHTQFIQWINEVATRTILLNSAETVLWNLNKRYMHDLEFNGIPVVQTAYTADYEPESVEEIIVENGWSDVVLKPSISAGGYHALLLKNPSSSDISSALNQLPDTGECMIQPLQEAILNEGEYSAVYINGKVSHLIRKFAKEGEFRVQPQHGGGEELLPVTREVRRFAEEIIGAIDPEPLYARIDYIRSADGNQKLMELELIEPNLFLRYSEEAVENLTRGIMRMGE